MNFEFFIAKRYLVSKHKLNFITIISLISALGITLGVAALIVILSVFNGFNRLVTSILVNFDPHIRITALTENFSGNENQFKNIFESNGNIKSHFPFAGGKAIIYKDGITNIVDVKGIPKDFDNENWGVKAATKYGKYDISGNQMIIGITLATKLQALRGDTVVITSFNSLSRSAISYQMPVTRKFVISGIFESNNNDYDALAVFTSLQNAQSLFEMKNQISGYEIRLNNITNSEKVKSYLQKNLDQNKFSINTWYDLHKDLYTVMQIERWAAYVILSLIIAIATFNVLGSLSMSVIEKKKDIGILRSMGAKDKSILRIFMFEGILIGIIGTFIGSILGYLIIFLQIKYKFYPLDPTRYIIDALPVEIRLADFFAVAGMSLFLSFIASLFPAKRALGVKAIDAIKWE